MRIISGTHKGRKLTPPSDQSIRPTPDRVREALFNILAHGALGERGLLRDTRILDLCCGTGALGLEAISRGAAHCTFIDNAPESLHLAEDNAATLKETAQCSFLRGNVTSLPRANTPVDVIFSDPPYDMPWLEQLVPALLQSGWAQSGTVFMLESSNAEYTPDTALATTLSSRKYGKSFVHVVEFV